MNEIWYQCLYDPSSSPPELIDDDGLLVGGARKPSVGVEIGMFSLCVDNVRSCNLNT
jgi:hypothetical protein